MISETFIVKKIIKGVKYFWIRGKWGYSGYFCSVLAENTLKSVIPSSKSWKLRQIWSYDIILVSKWHVWLQLSITIQNDIIHFNYLWEMLGNVKFPILTPRPQHWGSIWDSSEEVNIDDRFYQFVDIGKFKTFSILITINDTVYHFIVAKCK